MADLQTLVEGNRKGKFMGLHERNNYRGSKHIVGDTEYFKFFRFEFLVQSFQRRHFYFTGSAPGGPEIEKKEFAAVFLKGDFRTFRSLQGEIGCPDRFIGCFLGKTFYGRE